MANAKISDLTAASALAAADIAPVVQGGANVKATVQQIITAATGATGTNGETVTTSKPRLDLTQTWNNVATTLTGIKLNVTDTASAAASLLMDLQVGGVSRFAATKTGGLILPSGSGSVIGAAFFNGTNYTAVSANPSLIRLTDQNIDFSTIGGISAGNTFSFSARFGISNSTGVTFFTTTYFQTNTVQLQAAAELSWSSSGTYGTKDVALARDAAAALAQRNGVNAQTHRLYGTYTDGSNYRRLTKTMSTGGVAEIKPEGAGTGASGNVLHISGLPTSNPGPGILWNNLGIVNVGT